MLQWTKLLEICKALSYQRCLVMVRAASSNWTSGSLCQLRDNHALYSLPGVRYKPIMLCSCNYNGKMKGHFKFIFREKEQHERHMRQMEEEMELQVQRVEDRVRKRVSYMNSYMFRAYFHQIKWFSKVR